jgi:hypothetical protein
MRRALLLLVAAIALLVVPLGAAETSYTDPAGDAGPGPDITSVAVSNSDTGLITFNVTTGPVPDSLLTAWLDTDLNPMTGSDGLERVIMIGLSPSGVVLTAVGDPATQELQFGLIPATSAGGVVTFSFQKEALNIDEAFSFWLGTINMADDTGFADEAPDVGFWTYMLTKPAPPAPPPSVKPLIGKPVARTAPVAGKKFTVSFPIMSSVDKKPLTTGTAECKTTVAGKTVRHTHRFKGGTLTATVKVPKAAKGKKLKIAVKVTADKTATKVFTFKVK